MIRTSNIWS